MGYGFETVPASERALPGNGSGLHYRHGDKREISISPTTLADVQEYSGSLPPYRIKAWTGRLNGKIMGIGGIGRRPDGYDIVFFDCLPEARRLGPLTLSKMARFVMREVHRMGLSHVYAEADETVEAAARFLAWLGFQHIQGEVWIYETQS